MNDIIPEEALMTMEERFGTRLVRHTASEPDAEEPFASVFPQSASAVVSPVGQLSGIASTESSL